MADVEKTRIPSGPAEALCLSAERLAGFCRKWKVKELALFGSALRPDFGPESDVDFLVTFADSAEWGVLDHFRMEEELAEIVGREVDLVSRAAVERSMNWLRRRDILSTARTVYAA
jgi:uncharacterized protein